MTPIIEISNLGKKYTLVHDKVPYVIVRKYRIKVIKYG